MSDNKKTLIIIHRGKEYSRDFEEISKRVNQVDRLIEVACVSRVDMRLPSIDLWKNPTLIVSLTDSFKLKIERGKLIKNQAISKVVQCKRVNAAGWRSPPTLPFRLGMRLDPIMFGPLVVLKPMTLTSGPHVMLMRRSRAELVRPRDFDRNHPFNCDPYGCIVQKFIETGVYPISNRVYTFFGEPIRAISDRLLLPLPSLQSPDEILERAIITVNADEVETTELALASEEVEMARSIARVFDEVPLLGIDIVRETKTGALNFLECNPGGNTWHFSSMQTGGIKARMKLGAEAGPQKKYALERGRQKMIDQFSAFDVAARMLVMKTRELAI